METRNLPFRCAQKTFKTSIHPIRPSYSSRKHLSLSHRPHAENATTASDPIRTRTNPSQAPVYTPSKTRTPFASPSSNPPSPLSTPSEMKSFLETTRPPPPSTGPGIVSSNRSVSFSPSTTTNTSDPNPSLRALTGQLYRSWPSGSVYAPKDLSSVEASKVKRQRMAMSSARAAMLKPSNTRHRGWRDGFEDAGVHPLREWKNVALLSQFVSETGRIKSARENGLKAVNQRRVARAVRRAVATGLILPSTHRHPEMMEERIAQRNDLVGRTAKYMFNPRAYRVGNGA